jgi:hypothetical protein
MDISRRELKLRPTALRRDTLRNSTMDPAAGSGSIRWAKLCSHDYRDGIAPHTDR